MRAKEFLSEQETVLIHGKPYLVPTLPFAQKFPGNASFNYYHMYRFGIAMAQDPERMEQHADLGTVGSDLVVVPYSSKEQPILDKAAKKMKSPGVNVGHERGKEEMGVYSHSPVAKFKPTRRSN